MMYYFALMSLIFVAYHQTRCFAFNLTIIHTNDIHAHVDEMNTHSGECKEKDAKQNKCFGGVARRVAMVKKLRIEHPNNILLDAGDQFQGTLWFNEYKGLEASRFMNELNYDAMTFGNHEFDNGVEGLLPFVNNLSFPIINCNMNVSREPRLQNKFNKSVILNVAGQKVGVIGYTTPETHFISNPGSTFEFGDVYASVKQEVQRLRSLGINKIIGLGHFGYGNDQKLAKQVEGLDVIVGGHTHSFLYTGTPPSSETPEGDYPTVVTNLKGEKILVVQAYWSGKYLGFLNVKFDDQGKVVSWNGRPILLDSSVAKDNKTELEVQQLRKPLEALRRQVIGETSVYLEGDSKVCRLEECNLGNLITDGMVSYLVTQQHDSNAWTPAAIAIMNSGGIRAAIDTGNMTRGDLLTLMPFGNSVDTIEILGKHLRQAFEHSVENYDVTDRPGAFLQVSGVQVTYNLCKPKGQRVTALRVRCRTCNYPKYSDLKDNEMYSVVTLSFLIKGGDGYKVLKDHHNKWTRYNFLDSDVFAGYLKTHQPIIHGVEGRIILLNPTCETSTAVSYHKTLMPLTIVITLVCKHVII